jgi:hypothetical protein
MEIKPTGPGNIVYGNVKDAPGVGGPKQPFPAKQTSETAESAKPRSAELQNLAGLGKIEDLNDPDKTREIVRNALSEVCEPEFTQLTQQEKDGLTDFMTNDPLLSGRASKLMEKVFRGD